METRKTRALKIVQMGGVRRNEDKGEHWWLVPSQTLSGNYDVELPRDGRSSTCTCPDFAKPEIHFCKHILAAEIEKGRLFVDPVAAKKNEYQDNRDWAVVNEAHIREKELVYRFAHELCRGIVDPKQTCGRPRVPLRDIVFGALIWVYEGHASRTTMADFKRCRERDLISRPLDFRSLMRHLQNPQITSLLRALLRESALPMRHIETRFAVDATGFSTKQWHRWYDHKWGTARKEKIWLKAHAICGTDTRIVTDCVIEDVGDATKFPELVANTAVHFTMKEISADGAYASHKNVLAADEVGAVPYIPVEERIRDNKGPEVWRQMVGCFRYREDEFRAHYHQRSNVETVFSMTKTKFGGFVRSKKRVVQENEILCKFILHNFRVVTMAFLSMGEQPRILEAVG